MSDVLSNVPPTLGGYEDRLKMMRPLHKNEVPGLCTFSWCTHRLVFDITTNLSAPKDRCILLGLPSLP